MVVHTFKSSYLSSSRLTQTKAKDPVLKQTKAKKIRVLGQSSNGRAANMKP
jgi:hypothetical protein